MDLSRTNEIVGAAIGLATLLGLVFSWIRWVRPRLQRARAEAVAVRDSLVGREAIVDTITGRVISPALPGLGVRMEAVEHAQVETKQVLEHIATLIEGQQDQDRRIEDHEDRIKALEDQTVERVVTKVESAAAWRAVEAVAKTTPPDEIDDPQSP